MVVPCSSLMLCTNSSRLGAWTRVYAHVLYSAGKPQSGALMHTSERPPTRTSMSATVQAKPFGPHHCSTYSGSVHDFQASTSGTGNCATMRWT